MPKVPDIHVPKKALVHHVQSYSSVVPIVGDARARAVAKVHHHVGRVVAELFLALNLGNSVAPSTPLGRSRDGVFYELL